MAVVIAFAWLLALALGPLAVWHQMLSQIIASFHWSFTYVVAELSPWLLLGAGIVFLVPVAVSAGSNPDSRLYPRSRRAYIAWGTVVYILGLLLALQVNAVWGYAH